MIQDNIFCHVILVLGQASREVTVFLTTVWHFKDFERLAIYTVS